MQEWQALPVRCFFKKGGTAGTHVRTAPAIIMANDVSIVQLDGFVDSGDLLLSDAEIDHRHLR